MLAEIRGSKMKIGAVLIVKYFSFSLLVTQFFEQEQYSRKIHNFWTHHSKILSFVETETRKNPFADISFQNKL